MKLANQTQNFWRALFRRSRDKGYVPASLKQIGFIVGTGRCGTTILAKILNAHPSIVIPHELQIILGIGNGDRLHENFLSNRARDFQAEDFIQLIGQVCPYHFEQYFDYRAFFHSLEYPQTDLRTLLVRLFDAICSEQGKSVFLEQTPWYGQRLDLLKELFPELKVIHMVRDGRDVALSFSRTPWWSNDVAENLTQWAREVAVITSWGSAHPHLYRELRYEDLVTSPGEELNRLCDFLGLEPAGEMLDPDKLIDYDQWFKGDSTRLKSRENQDWDQKKDSPLFSGSVGAWKSTGLPAFGAMTEDVRTQLTAHGYEGNAGEGEGFDRGILPNTPGGHN